MDFDDLQPRLVVTLSLLALVPVAWYVLGKPDSWGLVAAVNVLIITASLWIAMRPLDGASHHGADQTT
ncbi:MAG: cytochrome-ba3 oxidase subunit [Halorubrum sp.]